MLLLLAPLEPGMLSGQGEGWTDGWMGRTEVMGHLLRWGISSKKPFSNHSSGFLFSHGYSGVGDWCRGAWSCQGGSETSCLSSRSLPASIQGIPCCQLRFCPWFPVSSPLCCHWRPSFHAHHPKRSYICVCVYLHMHM